MLQNNSIPQPALNEDEESLSQLTQRTRRQIARATKSESERFHAMVQFDNDLLTAAGNARSQAIVCRAYLSMFKDR